MQIIQFTSDNNNNQGFIVIGKAFYFPYALWNLPKQMDGKDVKVLGLTPFTVEEIVYFPVDKKDQANNIMGSHYPHRQQTAIDLIKSLS